ncbi:MAG: glycosyltransferase family 39 protein [Oscillospiraceae bacterium]|nr:glycosyltransferase family 39 protein [Oscillospiraceae bacterium]
MVKYFLMAALLIFIILIGYRFTELIMVHRLRPAGKTGAMERMDCILLAALTLLYGATAFYDLGDTQAPESFYKFEAGGSVVLDMGEVKEISNVYYYTGLNTGSYDLWGSLDGLEYEKYETLEQNYANLFDWNTGSGETTHTCRYLWIGTAYGLYVGEFVAVDTEGNPIRLTAVNGEGVELTDEFEKVPEDFTYRSGTYFDEIYHARTAYEHIVGMWPYEISHPPLGKLILSLGIRMFGMNPFGWRCMGTLAGVLMLPFLYLLAKRMFKSTLGALATTTFFAFDFMHFVQTRIATIDSYAVLFIIAMYYFMYCYVSENDGKSLALSGVCFGLGAASKWTCIYAGVGLGVIWLIHWIMKLMKEREYKAFAKNIGLCLIWFAAVPVMIYYMSYYPYGESQGMSGIGMFFDPDYAKIVWNNQVSMLTYHVGVDATHPYSSEWYQWIFNIRPILYYLYYGDGTRGSIAAFVSPLVCWGGLLAVVAMGYLTIVRKDKKAAFILLGYLSQLVPWVFVSRIKFAYHYFACVVFLCLALGYVASVLERGGRKKNVYAMMAVSVVLFAIFYPALTGRAVGSGYGTNVLKWLSSWPL